MEKLFSEFKKVTAAEWRTQLEKDLKGDTFESLVWKNENGFEINPFYTSEDLTTNYEPAFTHADWEVCVKLKAGNAQEINTTLLASLNSGATSFVLDLEKGDLDIQLRNVELNHIESTYVGDLSAFKNLISFFDKNGFLKATRASVFPKTFSEPADLENQIQLIELSKDSNVRTLAVDATHFHNKNCTAFYEVALIFSMLNEYFEDLSSKKAFPKSDIVIKTGVNSDYFIQIAKLRSIRRLFKIFKKEYGFSNNLHLIVETSLTNKTLSDSYNNLLRTTIESMAAIAGGCNQLIVNDFDYFFTRDQKLAARMSVNQQLILKEESYLNKMADVSCGSFFIETLTDKISQAALEKFKELETHGGFFKALQTGLINIEILKQSSAKEEILKAGNQLAIGVNKFRNEKENLNLNGADIQQLKQLSFSNPVLQFELEHFFNLKNA